MVQIDISHAFVAPVIAELFVFKNACYLLDTL